MYISDCTWLACVTNGAVSTGTYLAWECYGLIRCSPSARPGSGVVGKLKAMAEQAAAGAALRLAPAQTDDGSQEGLLIQISTGHYQFNHDHLLSLVPVSC